MAEVFCQGVVSFVFRDENYMRAWIEAVNRLIVRWGQIRDSINQI